MMHHLPKAMPLTLSCTIMYKKKCIFFTGWLLFYKFAWFNENTPVLPIPPTKTLLYNSVFLSVWDCFSGQAPCTLFAFLWSCPPTPGCVMAPCPPSPSLSPRGEEPASWPLSLQRSLYLWIFLHKTKKKKKNILCWLGGSFTALHLCLLLLQVPLFSTLEVMCWLRLPGGSFFPDTICLHFKLWWKASGNVCLNLQMNQVNTTYMTEFHLNIWCLSIP